MKAKKIVSFLLMLVLMFAMAACSNDEKASSDGKDKKFSGELTVWIHPYVSKDLKDKQTKVFEQMAASFNKEYPDVKVKFQEIPWANREQKILTALAANQGPDVFYLIPDMMGQFADKGVLAPITDLLGKDFDKEDFPQSSLDAVSYKGELYGLPILHEVRANVYNTKIMEEIGASKDDVPTTWEEFDALAEKAVAKGYYARGFEGGNTLNATLYPVLWQAGGDVLDKDGNVILNNDAGVKAFETINDWYKKGWIPKDSVNTLDHFANFLEGKSLSSGATGLTLSTLKQKGFKDYVLGPPLKGEVQSTFGTTGMFVVASNSDKKEAAAKLVEYMTNTENSKAFNELTQYIPPRKSAAGIYDNNPEMKQMVDWLKYTKPGVISPVARDILPKIQAEMQAMMEGKKTPKEAADAAAEAVKAELAKQ
ncbi:sugar ABC transporter substrate-binding protein [Falsibacillus pallidus]|uniref:Multiple sugar transport system substrate-binding protein/fructooligosaccharide transport system substrate-binding protein n=1 Tax=Falsibacillus pallidus TaxID=493781 RepID=A0A370G8B5_9BACI|nr:sugar ABC transporter substrate-binding protein [Falsibacillus pallidus]RDI40007.1 multiple sugar transport system substrate-binding protein/fructooligosaccharide transport system substrate-binding protein [Falsibacillus pallidus]